MFGALVRWVRRMRAGYPCDRCGAPGARLVVDATPAGKRVDGRTGLRVKTYAVRSCDWLCPACRAKPAGADGDRVPEGQG